LRGTEVLVLPRRYKVFEYPQLGKTDPSIDHHTGHTQNNGEVSKVDKKFIS
jgi:hypothetical protein